MRILKITALVVLACGFIASQANAASTVRLDYTGGSSVTGGTGGTAIVANASDLLSFDISVDVDAAGVATLAFGLSWFDDANSDLVGTTWAAGTVFSSFAPVTSANLTAPTAPSVNGGTGVISNIGWVPSSPTGPFITSTNVFLGTVVFHVQTTLANVAGTGFFDANFAIASDGALNLITPNFSVFTTNPVPEPGLATLMGLGLLGLALAGRKQRSL
jgi:hypothetical protein